jgi:hypothetical protein
MEHSSYCEADSSSLGKEVNFVLCRPNVYHTGPHPEANLSPLKDVSLSINLILISLPNYGLRMSRQK